ncbi:NYN domain-containing protein [Candidatus Woesearchaeota archaeon]|nr:NYN domain-containing protein [Candidatus Woesearchaeota archaeon]
MEKSVILIDAENLLKSWQSHFGKAIYIDYQKLIGTLSRNTNLLRCYYYDAVPETIPMKKKQFLNALQRKGMQLRLKVLKSRTIQCPSCSKLITRDVQKGVDVSLATDILRHAWQQTCDICIIVSGDEDYKDAIDVAKDKGIKIWIVSFRDSLSSELGRSADRVFYIEDIAHDLERNH